MKRILLLIIFFICGFTTTYSHEVNKYKYFCLDIAENPYDIEKRFIKEFLKIGFSTIDHDYYEQLDSKEKSLTLFAEYDYFINYNGPSSLTLVLRNEEGTPIWSSTGHGNTFLSAKGDMKSASNQITSAFSRLKYKFDENATKGSSLSSLEKDVSLAVTSTTSSGCTVGLSDVDIDIPSSKIVNDHTFAVVIANENYDLVAPVPMASNDGTVFAKYCEQALGIPKSNIRLYTNASFGTMIRAMRDIKDISDAFSGDIQTIFYYAGHGIPNEASKDAFLLPVDADGTTTDGCYSLKRLYKELAELNSKNTIVFLDACFCGSNRDGNMLASARGVKLRPKTEDPIGNMVIFSAASGDETASPYAEKNHGLFTYYLLKKIKESKGNIQLGELADYVKTNVRQQSVVVNRKSQTPTITPSSQVSATWDKIKLGEKE